MRFNVRFTPEGVVAVVCPGRIPTINHEGTAFTQNKRYRTNPPAIAEMVNRNGRSVYQTD
jgi:hypothetical protein